MTENGNKSKFNKEKWKFHFVIYKRKIRMSRYINAKIFCKYKLKNDIN